jgi:hypothetical protein
MSVRKVYLEVPKEWQNELKERLVKERDAECLLWEKQLKTYGYIKDEKTITNVIDTPNNPRTDNWIPLWSTPTSQCYLCRSVLAPSITGEYFGVCERKPNGEYSYRDSWDIIRSKMHKPHYACLNCRKAWKPLSRPEVVTVYYKHLEVHNPAITRCSSCRAPGTYMGLNFRAPRKTDVKAWKRVKEIIESNPRAFEANCKCIDAIK